MKMMQIAVVAIMATLSSAGEVPAQEKTAAEVVSIELNAVTPTEGGCTLSFMVMNGHASQIEKAVYETVLFDSAGQVDRLTLFDFGTLPPGRPRVRQFSVPDIACDGLGQILINGAHTCEAPELADTACADGLTLTTRTKIEVIG